MPGPHRVVLQMPDMHLLSPDRLQIGPRAEQDLRLEFTARTVEVRLVHEGEPVVGLAVRATCKESWFARETETDARGVATFPGHSFGLIEIRGHTGAGDDRLLGVVDPTVQSAGIPELEVPASVLPRAPRQRR